MGDIYQHYKDEVVIARGRSPTRMRQRIMSYDTWRKTIWFAKQVGLLEVAGRGDPVPGLLMVAPGGGSVVPSTPAILALTVAGRVATLEWDNLRKAYDVARGAALAPQPRPAVPTITLPEGFDRRSVPRLVMHLAALRDIGETVQWPEMEYQLLTEEVQRIQVVGEGWAERAQGELQERLEEFVQGLEDQELEAAQEALEAL